MEKVLAENLSGCFVHFVWQKNIPFRMITVGYFVPNVVDHAWVQA